MSEENKFVGYTKQDVMARLRIGSTTYHRLVKFGLLESSRLFPGGPRRHTVEQIEKYFHYLNETGVVEADNEFRRFQRRRVARS